MDKLRLKALAKINLGLDVLRRREDGYHEVRMIMQTVGIYDQIELVRQKEPGIRVKTNLFYLPENENNLVYKAAKLLIDEMQPLAETEITYQPLPKFPAITRDLSLVCADDVPVGVLQSVMKKAVGNILEQITLFDVYKGEQIASGMKSVSFSIRMRSHEGTLTDEQADAAMKRVLKALQEHGATLRA